MSTTVDTRFLLDSKSLDLNSSSQQSLEFLSNIRILDNPKDNETWIKHHKGNLYCISDDLIQRIAEVLPQKFTAQVADFNDNLSYKMQEQPGLEHLGIPSNLIGDVVGSNQFLLSFLSTDETIPQPAHVDYSWDNLEKYGDDLDIGFFPLTKDGMFLQVWSRDDDRNKIIKGELVYVLYGRLLTLTSKTIHGGGFRTTRNLGKHGNLRAHLYIARNGTSLSITQTNKYTEPGNKRYELSERYVDCSHMKEIVDFLFV